MEATKTVSGTWRMRIASRPFGRRSRAPVGSATSLAASLNLSRRWPTRDLPPEQVFDKARRRARSTV